MVVKYLDSWYVGSSYWEFELSGIENKGPKIREENGVYHISTFVFLFLHCTFSSNLIINVK